MIPVSLSIKGLYSYQDKKQTIDFDFLNSAGIFGVFGKVGSGKSSILEAISYALYGETERLNKREKRGYNMMNLKSKELLIDFIFKANKGNNLYRCIVRDKRNSKNFTEVKSLKREAFKKFENEWIPIELIEIEQVIGLNYTNFRRTVIIPQGKFQEFLQLGDADRTKMMKELFHLERFDLSAKIRNLELENNDKISGIKGQLIQLNEVSEEAINELQNKIQQTAELLKNENKEFDALNTKQKELQKTKELFTQLEKAQNEFSELKKKEKQVEELSNKLNEYNYCVLHFKSYFDQKEKLEKEIDNRNSELKILYIQQKELNVNLDKNKTKLFEIKPQFEQKEELKQDIGDLKKMVQINKLLKEKTDLDVRIKKGMDIIKKNKTTTEKLQELQNKLKEKIKDIKAQLPDIHILSELKNWYIRQNNLLNNKSKLTLELDQQLIQQKNADHQMLRLLSSEIKDLKTINLNVVNKEFETKTQQIEIEAEQIEKNLKKLQIKLSLHEFANKLKEGEICPVCGSKHHPEILKEEDISTKIEIFNSQKTTLKHKQNHIEKMKQSLKEYEIKTENNEANIIKIKTQISQIEQEASEQLRIYPSEKQIDEKLVDELFEKAKNQQSILNEKENLLQKNTEEIEQTLKNKEKYNETLNLLKNELSKISTEKETLVNQVNRTTFNEWNGKNESDIEPKIVTLNEKYQFINRTYNKLNNMVNEETAELAEIKGMIISKKSTHHLNLKDLEQIKKEIYKGLDNSDFKSEKQIKKLLTENYDIEALRNEIEQFRNELFSKNQQLVALQEKTKNKIFDQEIYNQLLSDIEQRNSIIEKQQQNLGALEKNKTFLEKKILIKLRLEKEYKNLEKRAENIAELKKLFKGNGFVNYVSGVYLKNLLNAANERFFKMTKQKLRLELTEENNFEVRDFLNEGKTRSVKTLSGGQTFQASLSLALALADSIKNINPDDNNFFFLDEGFGMLDNESLQIVFGTLKSLRKENRIVGVISHVEDLKQEFETYLNISNHPENGSIITKSWE